MRFTLQPNLHSGRIQFTGVSELHYMTIPYCTKVNVTVTGTFPDGDLTYQNILVDSVNMEVLLSQMCV